MVIQSLAKPEYSCSPEDAEDRWLVRAAGRDEGLAEALADLREREEAREGFLVPEAMPLRYAPPLTNPGIPREC